MTCSEGKGHPHADKMRQYAEDAAETDRPWERWEVKSDTGIDWHPLFKHPNWNTKHLYRRKPRSYRIEGRVGGSVVEAAHELLQHSIKCTDTNSLRAATVADALLNLVRED